jgi:hypothetical protein
MKRFHFLTVGGRKLALMIFLIWVSAAAADVETNRFGFTGPEIFPIDHEIAHLRGADLDGDGLQDLVVVNNARSKINLLWNQTGKTNRAETPPPRRELNELPPDARFRIDSIASEKRITSFTVADLNGDRRPDIAYYGEPKELVVQHNEAKGWSAPKRWTITDGLSNPNAMTHGDLNGDGRLDLVLLAESFAYLFRQSKEGALEEPEKIPYSGTVLAVQVLDIQGDGREDLLLVNWDSPNPFRFRLQDAQGQIGPEIHFSSPPIRSYWADDLDADRKTEVITVAQKSGRAQISNFTRKPAEILSGTWRQGQFQMLPLTRTSKARRGMIWTDLNRDALPDLVLAEPDSGQLTVHLQNRDGSLAAPKQFATLTGVTELAAGDWDSDGTVDLFLLSGDERQIGVTHFDAQGRFAFPKILPIEGRPLAMAVGVIEHPSKPTLAYVVDIDGKRELVRRDAMGEARRQKLSDTFKSNPSSISIHDADQDGLPDLVVLVPYEKIKLLLQVKEKEFDEHDVSPPGGTTEQPWLSSLDIDGDGKPELLLAQKNFLRAVVLQRSDGGDSRGRWQFQVKEQINGAASNSRIVAAAGLPQGTNTIAALFLLDAERKVLTLSERDPSGSWQIKRNVPLPVTEFSALHALALGASKPNAVGFSGVNAAAWMLLSGEVWELSELDGYETPINEGYLNDVISGDLNQDGRKDLVFMETAKSYLDIVSFEAPHRLEAANRWQVFEERTFRSRRNDFPEPREALILDLTGDGKNDLAVVVHDRILVYPQE